MKIEDIPDEIFDLLSERTYQELDANEKSKVDASIGAEQYIQFQSVVQGFHSVDIELADEPSQTPEKVVRPSKFARIFNYPIPLYRAVAACLIFGAVTFYASRLSSSTDRPSKHFNHEHAKGKTIEQDAYPMDLVFNL